MRVGGMRAVDKGAVPPEILEWERSGSCQVSYKIWRKQGQT